MSKQFSIATLLWLGLVGWLGAADLPPNVVIVFTDDQGYGDVGCFGATDVKTPRLDRLAKQGMRFTDFYVSQAVCTASRASLMTGCYANRVGLAGALNHSSTTGINEQETLLPELCKQRGYVTGIFGKWHLGHLPKFSPLRHGFDRFLGLPYSNDNSKYHPSVKNIPALPLIDGESVGQYDPDQSQFTRWFTDRAIQFIERYKQQPFFLYVPHVMPHVPIFASDKFRGKSSRGLYGDVLEELDSGIGEILDALETHGVADRTLVIFATDNGPFLSYGHHAGSAGPLREGKLTTFEGGVRVPCIMRWPGKIPAGTTCGEVASTIDLYPTIAKLIGATLPETILDGRDIQPLMTGQKDAKSPREFHFYYEGTELQAIRSGDWKLHFPHDYLTVVGEPGRDGKPANFGKLKPESIALSGIRGIASRHGYNVAHTDLALYNLRTDVGEKKNVAAEFPEIVKRLQVAAEAAREDLGDSLTKRVGKNLRPSG